MSGLGVLFFWPVSCAKAGVEMKILRAKDVTERTGLSRVTLWRRERVGTFPRRRDIGGGRVGWIESEINDWIANRPPVGSPARDHQAVRGD